MHNYFCDHCGAALDPGEICDCKQQPEESERRIVTYADWEAAGDFTKAARPGDYTRHGGHQAQLLARDHRAA